jgi:hypothetical protein
VGHCFLPAWPSIFHRYTGIASFKCHFLYFFRRVFDQTNKALLLFENKSVNLIAINNIFALINLPVACFVPPHCALQLNLIWNHRFNKISVTTKREDRAEWGVVNPLCDSLFLNVIANFHLPKLTHSPDTNQKRFQVATRYANPYKFAVLFSPCHSLAQQMDLPEERVDVDGNFEYKKIFLLFEVRGANTCDAPCCCSCFQLENKTHSRYLILTLSFQDVFLLIAVLSVMLIIEQSFIGLILPLFDAQMLNALICRQAISELFRSQRQSPSIRDFPDQFAFENRLRIDRNFCGDNPYQKSHRSLQLFVIVLRLIIVHCKYSHFLCLIIRQCLQMDLGR